MNSIYTAGKYARRDEIKALIPQLNNLGLTVTARWLFETAPLNVQLKDVQRLEQEEIALTDIQDIDSADGFLFFAENQNAQPPRGGRHVEFGYALARGKAIHVIGERENIFHYLPGVNLHRSFADFADHILQNQAHEVGH